MTLLPTACRVPHHHLAIDTYYKMSPPTLKLRPYHTPDKGVDSPAEEQDSLYSASDPSISSLHSSTSGAANLDVTGTGEKFFEALDSPTAPATPTSFPRLKTADKSKCPCNKSDSTSSKIICAACKQSWHQKCCNYSGLPAAAIKKLTRWQCPACYVCPALGKMPATVYTEIRAMRDTLAALTLRDSMFSSSYQQDIATLKTSAALFNTSELTLKIDSLQQEIHELKTSAYDRGETEFSQAVKAALDSAASVLPESLKEIQENLSNLNNRVSQLQDSVKTGGIASNCHYSAPAGSQILIQPNTASPNVKRIQTPCKPYESYESGAISQELKTELLEFIENLNPEFSSVDQNESRQVIYFGDYSYRDDEIMIDPESYIMTVSLGAKRTMTFCNNDETQSENLDLEDCSLLVTSRFAQDFWRHGILPQEEVSGERISLTFREISPHLMNSTLLLGDSNTARVSFGTGSGTLGAWAPGKRVKVGHIEALPDAVDIGPYRNITIHTGINSINSKFQPRSDAYLIHVLEKKCKEYMTVYPRAKIHISMLLPTRLRRLNQHVECFNRAILDMSYQYKNIRIIDNSMFGSYLCDEHGRWDTKENRPLVSDSLHLAKRGFVFLLLILRTQLLARVRAKLELDLMPVRVVTTGAAQHHGASNPL
ncbi:hypothetical protein ACHWQZ_G014696 [Mnemiopsis leidyi]